jgi:hypothetical protein
MNRSRIHYSIRLPLPAKSIGPDWLGAKFIATLDALTPIDPKVFTDWQVGELYKMRGIPLAEARPRIAEIIGGNVARDDAGRPDPVYGYSAVALTASGAESRRMGFSADTSATYDEGTVELSAGDIMAPADPAIVTYPLFRAALLAIKEIWHPPWSLARANRLGTVAIPTGGLGRIIKSVPQVPSDPTFPESIFFIPWIVYLAAESAAGLTLPSEIPSERTADGGLLMTAIEERLDPDNPAHTRRARILCDILIERTGYAFK